jgi:tetratricopeptide (TPR) repeat protein
MSRPLFRQRPRRAGCLPFVLLMGMMAGFALAAREFRSFTQPAPRPPLDLQQAETAFTNGDLDTTILLATELFENSPDNMAALTLLVRALIYRSYSDYDRAIDRQVALEISSGALARLPGNLNVLAIHAFALQANDSAAEAGRMALRVIERDDQNLPARLALALSYGSQGIFEAALREARRAVDIASVSAPQWLMDSQRVLAIAYSDLGRYADAITAVRAGIDAHKTMLALHFEQALYALQIGNSDMATSAYFRVIAYDENNVKARFRLCELSSTMREREAAVKYCQEVTTLAPEWSDGWYQLGREYFLQGNFKDAQQTLNRCSTLQVLQDMPIEKRRFECWYLQGQSAEILGDCAALMTTYNEFLTMSAGKNIPQTWTYPPEGPPICANLTPTGG